MEMGSLCKSLYTRDWYLFQPPECAAHLNLRGLKNPPLLCSARQCCLLDLRWLETSKQATLAAVERLFVAAVEIISCTPFTIILVKQHTSRPCIQSCASQKTRLFQSYTSMIIYAYTQSSMSWGWSQVEVSCESSFRLQLPDCNFQTA